MYENGNITDVRERDDITSHKWAQVG